MIWRRCAGRFRLWRTDYRCEPVGTQCHTYGISLWIPLSGTGAADVDRYIFRSNMSRSATAFGTCAIRSWTMT